MYYCVPGDWRPQARAWRGTRRVCNRVNYSNNQLTALKTKGMGVDRRAEGHSFSELGEGYSQQETLTLALV